MATKQASFHDLIAKHIDNLSFVEQDVESAARKLPTDFMDAAELRIKVMERARLAKSNIEVVKADLGAKARKDLEDDGRRATEGLVNETVQNDPTYQAAVEKHDKLSALEKQLDHLLEAFRMKSSAIQVVAKIQVTEGAGLAGAVAAVQNEQLQNAARKQKYKK